MKRHPSPIRRLADRLDVRLSLLLALALLPLGVLLIVQASERDRESRQRGDEALAGATLFVAGPVVRDISRVRALAEGLGSALPPFLGDPERCAALLSGARDGARGTIRFLGVVSDTGQVVCSAHHAAVTAPPAFRTEEYFAAPVPRLVYLPSGFIFDQSVLAVVQPIPAEGGRVPALLVATIGQDTLRARALSETPKSPAKVLTFSRTGDLVAATIEDAERALREAPADLLTWLVPGDGPRTFRAQAVSGAMRDYTVVPVADSEVFIMSVWPEKGPAGRVGVLERLPTTAFVIVMWIASLGAAILASELLVTRHIRTLRASMVRFASGDRSTATPVLKGAPAELRAVANSFAAMTEAITRDEAELENALHQKNTLLREVHHRVKNNLQLIASIMSLQLRRTRTPEARELLRGLQERVMSLAMVHRELYQTSGLVSVRADELLSEIVRQLVALGSGGGREYRVETRLADIRLVPDQAVPLALLMTEALSNAMKYAAPANEGDRRPSVLVSLQRPGGEGLVELVVENSVSGARRERPLTGDEGTLLGGQLMQAFALQIGGTLNTE
ncbi:MAG: sensor histidine kinase, partial [Gemmobacter sp.]